MATLENSHRTILKATHTAIELSRDTLDSLNRATEKQAYVRALALRNGEVTRAIRSAPPGREITADTVRILEQFEERTLHTLPPDASALARIPSASLEAFGEALIALRSKDAEAAYEAKPDESPAHDSAQQSLISRPSPLYALSAQLPVAAPNMMRTMQGGGPLMRAEDALLQISRDALNAFRAAMRVSPIGMLHLERIEMSPAGVERGELLATIALAPGEKTAVEQKEWTVTEEELSTIVTDSLEEYTEKGVTEKSELAQSTTSESKRSQQLGIGATLSGTYGIVTFSTSTNFSSAVEASSSGKESRTHAQEVTAKASARVRKERKVTIQTKTTYGSQETTTREISNPSANGMRIDYFSMMRRWRVRLLQYGLRQTYDIAIPSPGAMLRNVCYTIHWLNAQIDQPFSFPVKVEDITRNSYRDLATQWGAAVPEPPGPGYQVRVGGPVPGLDKGSGWKFHSVDLDVPDGYEVTSVTLDAMLGNVNNDDPGQRAFLVFGYGSPRRNGAGVHVPNSLYENGRASFVENMTDETGFMKGARGRHSLQCFLHHIDAAAVTYLVALNPTAEAMSKWHFAVWQALHDAAAAVHYAKAQAYTGQRDALQASISAIDTLTLRREERDEIMRGVLHWLLGPAFEFMPDVVEAMFQGQPGTTISLTSNELNISESQWRQMFRYQEMIKFVHQAIEWENLLYFIYPYFWDLPAQWNFIRTLEHPDPERQRFIRAGSARVVLTVRPGFEKAFAEFVDNGSFGTLLPPNHPYVTIGQEIAAYGKTNYPGIPPANPALGYRPLLSPLQRRAWADMIKIIDTLEKWRETHNDTYPTTAEGLAVLPGPLPLTDPWGNAYVYASPGRATEFELSSAGEDGISGPDPDGLNDDITSWAPASLIGEWFEYTPTRGIDIAVNSVLAEMA